MTVQQIRHAGASKIEGRGASVADTGESRNDHSTVVRRGRGRPPGSKNKPKGLIPREFASEFLGIVRDLLPPEHYEEMRQAVVEGKSISTLAEAKITLKLMGPPIWRRLIEEGKPKEKAIDIDDDALEEIGGAPQSSMVFSRDLNDRLGVYMKLMDFIEKSERRDDEAAGSRQKPIVEVYARRGIDTDRLRVLVGVESGSLGRDANESGREPDSPRAIPDTIPQRPLDLQDNEEVEADWDEHGDSGGSGLQHDDEALLQREHSIDDSGRG